MNIKSLRVFNSKLDDYTVMAGINLLFLEN
jgi:hypothetical protein